MSSPQQPNSSKKAASSSSTAATPKHFTIDQICEICASKKFTSQEKLFTYIASENAKIMAADPSFSAPNDVSSSSSSSSRANSHMQYLSASGDLVLPSASSSGVGADPFSFSSSFAARGGDMMQEMLGGGGGGGVFSSIAAGSSSIFDGIPASSPFSNHRPLQQKLLRPFCVHVNPLSAAALASVGEIAGNNTVGASAKSRDTASNFFAMSHYADVTNVSRLRPMSSSTQTNTTTTTSSLSLTPSRRTRSATDAPDNNNNTQQQQQQNENKDGADAVVPMQQTRFFLAMTSDHFFNKVVRNPNFPRSEQHFFEIIQEGSPCSIYFDVEMEHDHGLTRQEHGDLKEQLLQWIDVVCVNTRLPGGVKDMTARMMDRFKIPTETRVRTRCCPVDCHVEFDPTTTRDVLVSELTHFINNVFQLPLLFGNKRHDQQQQLFAQISDACFCVLVSSTPSATKFSQHYIVRFTDETVRFANNLDVKIVVYSFVQYLYRRAVEDPKVHAALFYHESTKRRKCSATIPSSSTRPLSTSNTTTSSSSQKTVSSPPQQSQATSSSAATTTQRLANSSQLLDNSNAIVADYTVPAIGLSCIIDEAVYSRNRMMRCYGSCKVGKAAVLEFDEPWHHHHHSSNSGHGPDSQRRGCPVTDKLYESTLISEPFVLSAPQQQPLQQQQQQQSSSSLSLFKFVDSDKIAEYAIANGNANLVASARGGSGSGCAAGSAAAVAVPQIRTVAQQQSAAAFHAHHDTTQLNSAAATIKLPFLCKEICELQTKLDKTGVSSGNVMIETLQVHIPKDENDVVTTMASGDDARTTNATMIITAKIRGSRWCDIVKRPHRSNGVFWVAKYYAKSDAAVLEQRCFDSECKSKAGSRYSKEVSSMTCTELRMYCGAGNSPWLQASCGGISSRPSCGTSSQQQGGGGFNSNNQRIVTTTIGGTHNIRMQFASGPSTSGLVVKPEQPMLLQPTQQQSPKKRITLWSESNNKSGSSS